jgi:hypothetical protein
MRYRIGSKILFCLDKVHYLILRNDPEATKSKK